MAERENVATAAVEPVSASARAPRVDAEALVSASPRVVIDGVKLGTRSTVVINGQTRDVKDSTFIVFLRLVATEMRRPGTWMTRHELGIVDNRAMTTHLRDLFAGLVPEGFKVMLGDRAGSYRLNPAIVIERVEWGVLEGHPNAGVARVAREMRARGK